MSIKKYLVKAEYETSGCDEFRKDMEYWKKHPITSYTWDEEESGIVVGALTPLEGWSEWIIYECDLIPYSPPVLENK